jgi:hypothetical protein
VTLYSDSLAIQDLALQHKYKENDSPQLCAEGDSESIETVKEAHATATLHPIGSKRKISAALTLSLSAVGHKTLAYTIVKERQRPLMQCRWVVQRVVSSEKVGGSRVTSTLGTWYGGVVMGVLLSFNEAAILYRDFNSAPSQQQKIIVFAANNNRCCECHVALTILL